MRHRVANRKLGRYSSHRLAMLANMSSSLFLEGSIVTTVSKAKELRKVAEKLITRAKSGEVNDRRIVMARMPHKEAVAKLFNELGPKYADRNGGYTRIVKLGARLGDASEMAVIQLVD
ncbi:MAG: 50S ribosomal protein L17 [Synergistaceae bacterium]|nr:50S ribosomal protein L17 [Synergistaceae bacterium]